MSGLVDRVFALLPDDGGPVLYEELLRLARERQIFPADLGKAVSVLCSSQRASSQDAQGLTFVRRLVDGAQRLVPRPRRAASPRARR